MRYNKYITLLFMAVLVGCQEKEVGIKYSVNQASNIKIHADSVKLNPGKGLVFLKDQPFSGISYSNFESGAKAEIITYNNGKRHGDHKKWFADGTLSYHSIYEMGKKNGASFSWWKNGNKRSASNFTSGIPHGVQLQWYQSGSKFKAINLDQGKELGLQQSWRENGKIYNNYEAKNGRVFGLKRANLCYGLEDEKVQYNN